MNRSPHNQITDPEVINYLQRALFFDEIEIYWRENYGMCPGPIIDTLADMVPNTHIMEVNYVPLERVVEIWNGADIDDMWIKI